MANHINHDAFSELTPEALYWIGFMLADGCVRLEKRVFKTGTIKYYKSVSIALAVRDIEQLRRLKDFLQSGHKITEYLNKGTFGAYTQCRLSFLSPTIFDRLSEFGVVPNKTEGTSLPDTVALDKNFWRGFVDGDGYITISRSWKSRVPFIGACGCESVISSFQAYLEHLTGTRYSITPSLSTKKCVAIKVNGPQAVKVISVLYGDATVSLSRKLETARQILKIYDQYKPEVAHAPSRAIQA
jgi:hypothetical protein